MIPIGILVLIVVAGAAFATVVAVMYYGSKENLDAHVNHSVAQATWEERAKRVDAARNSLVMVAEGADAGTGGSVTISAVDEAEARRQAALARKAARAARPAGE